MIRYVGNDVRIPNPEDARGIIIAREIYVEIFSVSFRGHADVEWFTISLPDNVAIAEVLFSGPVEKC